MNCWFIQRDFIEMVNQSNERWCITKSKRFSFFCLAFKENQCVCKPKLKRGKRMRWKKMKWSKINHLKSKASAREQYARTAYIHSYKFRHPNRMICVLKCMEITIENEGMRREKDFYFLISFLAILLSLWWYFSKFSVNIEKWNQVKKRCIIDVDVCFTLKYCWVDFKRIYCAILGTIFELHKFFGSQMVVGFFGSNNFIE